MLKSLKMIYIQKTTDGPTIADQYIQRVWMYMGAILSLGNSLILSLSQVLEMFEQPVNSGMLGKHLTKFKSIDLQLVGITTEEHLRIISDLEKFNKILNLVKHSLFVLNPVYFKANNETIALMDFQTKEQYILTKEQQDENKKLCQTLLEDMTKILQ